MSYYPKEKVWIPEFDVSEWYERDRTILNKLLQHKIKSMS